MRVNISPTDRAWRGVLLVVLALGLSIRLAWVLWLPTSEAHLASLPDQLEYLELGRNLAGGRGLVFYSDRFTDELRAYRMPGYPLLVAACRGHVATVRLAQAIIDASTALAVYLLARRWLMPGAGVLAATLVSFNPFLIFFSGLILSETLFTAMLAWGMALIILHGRTAGLGGALAWWAGALVLALSVLVRPSALLLPILLAVAGAVANRGSRAPYLSKWAPPVASSVLLLQLAILLPWGYRNYRLLGAWIFTTTNSGITLYDGLNPDATGASDQRFLAEMPQLRSMGEVQRSQYLARRAYQYARGHPRRALQLAAVKVARTWSPVPLSADYGSRRNVVIASVYMIPLLLLVVAGLWLGPMPLRAKVFLLVPAIYFTAVHAWSVGSLRYRVPADVPMAVIAAAGVAAAVKRASSAESGGQPAASDPLS